MNEHWLEIENSNINAQEIEDKIGRKLAAREDDAASTSGETPEAIAKALWNEMIGDASGETDRRQGHSLQLGDCDIVPRDYVIDWQIPILGPINVLVRRVINTELRRYLLPALEKQSYLNRQLLRALTDLSEENNILRREIEHLRNKRE